MHDVEKMTTIERTVSATSTKLTARSSSCTSVSSTHKQNRSHFAKYYSDLCHIQHSHPLSAIKQNLDKGILDFYCDRIKFEEWWSIINALSCDKTLHFVAIRCRHPQKQALEFADTELKAKSVTKQPVVTTRFVLLWLTEAIKMCLGHSSTLTVLELEGLPLTKDYLTSITRGLNETTTLQHFSLSKCPIGDEGAEIICQVIRNLPSIVSLDLSQCNLTEKGAEIISGLIKYQKLNRYSEAWKQTLRYRDPDVEAMPGLRRITVNSNPGLGDEGVGILAEEIKDDLWLRALDVQDCGLTDIGGRFLLDLLESNSNLVIVDGRGNPLMNEKILLEIMSQLALNNQNKNETEYKWINKNPDLNKKKFQVSNVRPRPWTSQSSTRLTNKAPPPSEYSTTSAFARPLLRRSNTTLNGDSLWKKNQKGIAQKTSNKEDIKTAENQRLRLQLRDLTLVLNQEVRQKLALMEENKALKELLEKEANEKKKEQEMSNNKFKINKDAFKIIEETINNFEMCLQQKHNKNKEKEEEEEEEISVEDDGEVTTARNINDYNLPELVSNLQNIFNKATSTMEQNECNKKFSDRNHMDKLQHSKSEIRSPVQNKKLFVDLKLGNENNEDSPINENIQALEKNRKAQWGKNKTHQVIWEEEEETTSNCGDFSPKEHIPSVKSKAQAMFLKILEEKQEKKNFMAENNPNSTGEFELDNSNDEVSSESDTDSQPARNFKKLLSSSNKYTSS